MDEKMRIIREAAALIGADEETLSEDEARKILRSLVMTNESVRIRKAKTVVDRLRKERNE
jgi:plasmid stability protein